MRQDLVTTTPAAALVAAGTNVQAAIEGAVAEIIPGIRLETRWVAGTGEHALTATHLPANVSQAQIDEARHAIELSLTPAPMGDLVQWITRVQMLTVRRPGEEADTKAQAKLYAHELSCYPADIVREVLDDVSRWRFFPAWAEIEPHLRVRVARRDALAAQAARWRPMRDGLPENLTAADLPWLKKRRSDALFDVKLFRRRAPDRAQAAEDLAARLGDVIARMESGTKS